MSFRTTAQPRRLAAALAATALVTGVSACGADNESASGNSSLEARVAALESRLAGQGAAAPAVTTAPAVVTSPALDLAGTISGAGASSQAAAMEAWIAGFTAKYPDVTVNYDPQGSGAGREQFSAGAVPFAGSDAALDAEELAAAKAACVDVVQVPLYVSPIAIAFNLDGIESLQLKADTIAKIFDQKITSWNDPAIAADNSGVTLPDLDITVVNRSDESGTTENFVEYLKAAAPQSWPHEVSGDWPIAGGEAAQGTSGVVGAMSGGNGTIGYADASQVDDLGVVKVGVGTSFVGPSPDAAASILGASERIAGQSATSFAYELDRATDTAGTYPVVLVSYSLACTQYDSQEQVDLVKAFLGYIASDEGQKVAQTAAGSAPLSATQRDEFLAAINAITVKS
ncbi:MAG: phosphate ABC transporter substrate-binding protein PstS [Sporichthyaceae bacterium]